MSLAGVYIIDNWKTLFSTKIYHYPGVWCNRHVAAFFETSQKKNTETPTIQAIMIIQMLKGL